MQVYRAHKDRLLTATTVLLGGDQSTAEDILHDVFIQLVEQAASLQVKGKLRNYLITCCLNKTRDHLRRQDIDRRVKQRSNNSPYDDADQSEQMEAEELRLKLLDFLARLPDSQREVVTLHVQGDMTFAEVADTLSISVNTAKSRYRYAIDKLQGWASSDRIGSGEK